MQRSGTLPEWRTSPSGSRTSSCTHAPPNCSRTTSSSSRPSSSCRSHENAPPHLPPPLSVFHHSVREAHGSTGSTNMRFKAYAWMVFQKSLLQMRKRKKDDHLLIEICASISCVQESCSIGSAIALRAVFLTTSAYHPARRTAGEFVGHVCFQERCVHIKCKKRPCLEP